MTLKSENFSFVKLNQNSFLFSLTTHIQLPDLHKGGH